MENQAQTQEQTASTQARIRKNVEQGAIEVSRVYKGDYNKAGEVTAELKQEVTTTSFYPTKQIRNDKQDNIYGLQDFGGTHTEKEYVNKERRVTWITVPEGETPEKVAEKLKAFPNARLYRMLANVPILSDNQKAGIEAGLTTKEVFAKRQIVRNPETGQIVLDKAGKPQYRAIFFSNDGKSDVDLRDSNPENKWVSEELKAEIDNMEGTEHIVPEQKI